MAKLTKTQLGALALEALREMFPQEAPDNRTLRELRKLFEDMYLGGYLRQFQATKAAKARAKIDIDDLD